MQRNIIPRFTFLLLALGAELPLRGAPTRLYEIGANRVVERGSELLMQRGLLNALGSFRVVDESPVLSTVGVPVAARDKVLISIDAWLAYERLGPEALVRFAADPEGTRYTLGFRGYIPVAASSLAPLDDGTLINLSTRAHASATNKLIGGFVIDGRHRRVLVRAVGPGLAEFGVTDRMTDPFVTIFGGNTPIHFNGDWSTRTDTAELGQAAARVGAFPLAAGSKDSALLVELAPGNYTVQVEPESGEGGAVLMEIYSVP